MRWQYKAAIMHICARLPYGDRLYRWGQKRIGRLRFKPTRLPMQIQIVRWLAEQGKSVQGAKLFEVGTGHIPSVPIGFFLSGAKQVITVDLHRRVEWDLVHDCLKWFASHRNQVEKLYLSVVPKSVFDERFAMLVKCKNAPMHFLQKAGIEYLAPMDAAHTNLSTQSVDCHFSVTVLEHIPPAIIVDILTEAKRVLKPTGTAIHFIDTSDHFHHQDRTISSINFLKFSDSEWDRVAGNEFAYCNRLRASDYVKLFSSLSFQLTRYETTVDAKALKDLHGREEKLHSKFRSYEPEDICTTSLRIMCALNPDR
jgi:hypothetical protein